MNPFPWWTLHPPPKATGSLQLALHTCLPLYVCLQCRLVESITDFCYNPNGYTGVPPPPPPGSVTLEVEINLGAADSVPCPTTPAEWAKLYSDLELVSWQVSQASVSNVNGVLRPVVAGIAWTPIDSSTCAGARTQVRA